MSQALAARWRSQDLLDLGDASATTMPHLARLVAGMTDRLRAAGLRSGIVLRRVDGPRDAAVAAAVDLVVLALEGTGGGPSWTARVERALAAAGHEVPARAVLLQVPARLGGDLAQASSLVRDQGLRGLALPAAIVAAAAPVVGHDFQVRGRAGAATEPPPASAG
jgi:hypothetical protein